MGTGGSAERVRHLDRAGDAGAEADAVIGAGNIVVHGLGDGDDANPFLVEAHAVAERVVSADRNHVLDAQPRQILQNLGRQVVLLRVVLALKMFGHAVLADAAGIRTR